MSSTHDVNCRKCGKKIAWWSQFDNIQYQDEYECQGEIWKKWKGQWQGLNSSGKRVWSGNFKPSIRELKDDDMKHVKTIKPLTKELWPCSLENQTQYCRECAKELDFRCPKCGGNIKLIRKA